MKSSRLYIALTLVLSIFFLPGCSQVLMPSPVVEAVTFSPTIELELTPTVTPTPIPSVTNSPIPSLTHIPTLSLAEARAMVSTLYENNGGCRFPCWWGIEPGVSSWSTTRNFLTSFSEKISSPSTRDFFGKVTGYAVYFPLDTESGNRLSLEINEQDNVIRFIGAGVHKEFERMNNSTKYFLYSLLEEYGAPDQVYLYTQPFTPDNSFPFSVILFYKSQRFALIYMGYGVPQNNQVRACFENDFSFLSWAPDTISDLDDFTKVGMRPEDLSQYRPLEEVTELDLSAFDKTFKNRSTAFCLETPIELWP